MPPSNLALSKGDTELIEDYIATLQAVRSRSTTYDSLRRIARALKIEGGPELVPWGQLGHREFQLIRVRLAETQGPGTANVTLSALRGIYRTAYHQGKVPLEVYLAARDLRAVRGVRLPAGRAVSPEELRRLFLAAETAQESVSGGESWPGWGLQAQALVAAMAGLGLRREEAAELELDAIGGEEVSVLGKGNRERRAYLDPPTRARLERWLSVRRTVDVEHRGVFLDRSRRQIRADGVWRVVVRLGELAGVSVRPHDLRRTFASRLLDCGLDLAQVQRLLGHASIRTTAIYDRREEVALAERRQGARVFEA